MYPARAPGVDLSEDSIGRFPAFSAGALLDPEALAHLLQVYEGVLAQDQRDPEET